MQDWTEAELAALELAFGSESDQAWMGSMLRWPQVPLQAEPLLIADSELIRSRDVLLDRASVRDWYTVSDSALAEFSKRFPNTSFDTEGSYVGGHPGWIQGPDLQQLPFFLQLYPEGDMMWGDAGRFYLFLDPANPQGSKLIRQMH